MHQGNTYQYISYGGMFLVFMLFWRVTVIYQVFKCIDIFFYKIKIFCYVFYCCCLWGSGASRSLPPLASRPHWSPWAPTNSDSSIFDSFCSINIEITDNLITELFLRFLCTLKTVKMECFSLGQYKILSSFQWIFDLKKQIVTQ